VGMILRGDLIDGQSGEHECDGDAVLHKSPRMRIGGF